MTWLHRWWTSLTDETPHQSDVRDRVAALPALPEQDRMRTKAFVQRKPRNLREWDDRYSRKRA